MRVEAGLDTSAIAAPRTAPWPGAYDAPRPYTVTGSQAGGSPLALRAGDVEGEGGADLVLAS